MEREGAPRSSERGVGSRGTCLDADRWKAYTTVSIGPPIVVSCPQAQLRAQRYAGVIPEVSAQRSGAVNGGAQHSPNRLGHWLEQHAIDTRIPGRAVGHRVDVDTGRRVPRAGLFPAHGDRLTAPIVELRKTPRRCTRGQ